MSSCLAWKAWKTVGSRIIGFSPLLQATCWKVFHLLLGKVNKVEYHVHDICVLGNLLLMGNNVNCGSGGLICWLKLGTRTFMNGIKHKKGLTEMARKFGERLVVAVWNL